MASLHPLLLSENFSLFFVVATAMTSALLLVGCAKKKSEKIITGNKTLLDKVNEASSLTKQLDRDRGKPPTPPKSAPLPPIPSSDNDSVLAGAAKESRTPTERLQESSPKPYKDRKDEPISVSLSAKASAKLPKEKKKKVKAPPPPKTLSSPLQWSEYVETPNAPHTGGTSVLLEKKKSKEEEVHELIVKHVAGAEKRKQKLGNHDRKRVDEEVDVFIAAQLSTLPQFKLTDSTLAAYRASALEEVKIQQTQEQARLSVAFEAALGRLPTLVMEIQRRRAKAAARAKGERKQPGDPNSDDDEDEPIYTLLNQFVPRVSDEMVARVKAIVIMYEEQLASSAATLQSKRTDELRALIVPQANKGLSKDAALMTPEATDDGEEKRHNKGLTAKKNRRTVEKKTEAPTMTTEVEVPSRDDDERIPGAKTKTGSKCDASKDGVERKTDRTTDKTERVDATKTDEI